MGVEEAVEVPNPAPSSHKVRSSFCWSTAHSPTPHPAPLLVPPRHPPTHTHTIMKVSEEPRNWMLTQGAAASKMPPPNSSIHRKSAERLRNDPSSSDLLYLTRKNM